LKESREEGLRWLFQAENDLEFARLGLKEGFYAQVCFQAQQVCEKLLKAYRYGLLGERIVLGHSLVELSRGLDIPGEIGKRLPLLDQYYIPTRYPNGLPGTTPFSVYTQEQAAAAVETSAGLNLWVRGCFGE
jgi:HEPN domain-containing protein